jgi:hypothetical protein
MIVHILLNVYFTFVAKLADDLTTFCGAGYENYLFCEICGWIVVIITHCKD